MPRLLEVGGLLVSLSIVVVGRNDNYRGSFIKNLEQWLLNTHRLLPQAEIVLVDWNPPPDKKLLANAILWPADINAKLIVVSAQIHESINNPLGLPLLEYWAKNVGIRRASGDFVLATNPDTLISDRLAEEILGSLKPAMYWRANRVDVEPVPMGTSVLHPLTVHGQWGSYKYKKLDLKAHTIAGLRRARRHWKYRSWQVPHENAAGDFLLAPMFVWNELGGWPEIASIVNHIDGIMMCRIHKLVDGRVFQGPLYHQGRERALTRDMSVENLKADTMRGLPFLPKPDWGLGTASLPTQAYP